MFSSQRSVLLRISCEVSNEGVAFLSFPSSAQTEVQAWNTWPEAQENNMIYINKCSLFSSPVNVTFGYEIEFCKVIFFKYSFRSVSFITIDTDDRLKNHSSLFPTPFLACISSRLTSWVTAIIGALRCPFGSLVTQYSRDGVLFRGQALPWTLTVPKNGLVWDGIVIVLYWVSVWLGNLHMGYPMLGSLALNFSILLFACQKTWSWPSQRLCIVIASQGQAMN